MKTVDEISAEIFAPPQIIDSFVQQTNALDLINTVKGDASEMQKGVKFRREFRVFIRTAKAFYESTNYDLEKAAAEAFQKSGIEL